MPKMVKLDSMMWLVIEEKNITLILLTWEIIHLMNLPLRKKHISMWWVYKIKFAFDGKLSN
jgi:hypothetical protein